MLYEVVAELSFDLILGVPETLLYELLHLIVIKLRDACGLFHVLNKLCHRPHRKGRNKVTVQSVTIENPENLQGVLFAHDIIFDDGEKRVLIYLCVLAFLTSKFDVIELLFVISLEVLKDILPIED